jgi:hypothetical protein
MKLTETITAYTFTAIDRFGEGNLIGTLIHNERRAYCDGHEGLAGPRASDRIEVFSELPTFDTSNPRHVAVLLGALLQTQNLYLLGGAVGGAAKLIIYASTSPSALDSDRPILATSALTPYGKNLTQHLHIVKGR